MRYSDKMHRKKDMYIYYIYVYVTARNHTRVEYIYIRGSLTKLGVHSCRSDLPTDNCVAFPQMAMKMNAIDPIQSIVQS